MEFIAGDYTRHYIVQALFKLMAVRDFHEISVSDIVRKAGVGRASFYRLFGSKEEVIRYYFARESADFQALRLPRPRCLEDYRELILTIMRTFEKNKGPLRLLQKAHLEYLYLEYLNEKFSGMFSDDLLETNPYKALAYSGSLFNISMKWLSEDCQAPAEEVTEAMLSAVFALRRSES